MLQNTQKILLLDIEKQLAKDHSGDLKKELLLRLETIRARTEKHLRAMNERDKYQQLTAALAAVDGAIVALNSIKPIQILPERQTRSAFSISTFFK